jgi:hypothetical protein
MDERDREEEGKDREGEGWKIGIKKVFFLECLGIFILSLWCIPIYF